MNIILKGKGNNDYEISIIQGGSIMNLLNMINIVENHNENKASKPLRKAMNRKGNGYSIYESLEFFKSNNKDTGFMLGMEMYRAFLR